MGGYIIICNFPDDLGFSSSITYQADEDHDGDSDYSYIKSKKAIKLYYKLEKLKGTLTDTVVFKKQFQKYIQQNYVTVAEGLDIADKLNKNYRENNIKTLENLIIYHLKLFLRYIGFDQIASKVGNCADFQNFVQQLKALQADNFPSGTELEIEKTKLKIANTDTDRKKLSKKKKQLSKKLKNQKKIIFGIIAAISQYEFVAPFFKKFLKQLQSYLVFGNGHSGETKIYLDGKLDLFYDRNPGRVSGDCTNNEPLPFDNPDIPIYNVKVFNKDKIHIGNIYLLSTKSVDNKTCWHLEAIQIPSTINWETGIAKIIQRLGVEAKKNGIEMITINNELPHISNYDYIQNAVFDYQKKVNLGSSNIQVPHVEN